MRLFQFIPKILKISLLFLFIGYYSGKTLFYHVHLINGKVVAHSHFCNTNETNPQSKHTHPHSAYDIIDGLNKFDSKSLIIVNPYQSPNLVISQFYYKCFSTKTFTNFYTKLPARAPPAC